MAFKKVGTGRRPQMNKEVVKDVEEIIEDGIEEVVDEIIEEGVEEEMVNEEIIEEGVEEEMVNEEVKSTNGVKPTLGKKIDEKDPWEVEGHKMTRDSFKRIVRSKLLEMYSDISLADAERCINAVEESIVEITDSYDLGFAGGVFKNTTTEGYVVSKAPAVDYYSCIKNRRRVTFSKVVGDEGNYRGTTDDKRTTFKVTHKKDAEGNWKAAKGNIKL